jgi:hypothetical protein
MSSLVARFGAWLRSVEFAVTATSVVVALIAGQVAFTVSHETTDGFFVILLAGVAVPGIYETNWPTAYDRRLVGAAWAVGACVAVLACYVVVLAALSLVLDGVAPSAAAFATAWLLGIMAAGATEIESP